MSGTSVVSVDASWSRFRRLLRSHGLVVLFSFRYSSCCFEDYSSTSQGNSSRSNYNVRLTSLTLVRSMVRDQRREQTRTRGEGLSTVNVSTRNGL